MRKKKRVYAVVFFFLLFLFSFFLTFLLLSPDGLNFTNTNAQISFPQAVSAQAKIQYVNMDHTYWKEIEMEFPDVSGAKELYNLESWANSYEYDTQLLLAPWVLEVVYFLPDGTCVRRTYQKAGADAMLADFIKAHAAFITDQGPASFS